MLCNSQGCKNFHYLHKMKIVFMGIQLPALCHNGPTKLLVQIFGGQSTVHPLNSQEFLALKDCTIRNTFDLGSTPLCSLTFIQGLYNTNVSFIIKIQILPQQAPIVSLLNSHLGSFINDVCMFSTADLEIKNVPNPLRWYHLSAICPEDI